MSQIEKIGRANMFVRRNQEIIATIKKMLKEYEHNHTCAKNLYIKAQVPMENVPIGYEDGSYPSYNFTSGW